MAKKYVLVLGIIFLIVGILGFFGPLTPNGNLFGIFAITGQNSVVYVLSGILALIALAGGEGYARLYAKVFGVIYAVVTVLGFMVGNGEVLGLLTVNGADTILHLLIAASALYVGFAADGNKPRQAAA